MSKQYRDKQGKVYPIRVLRKADLPRFLIVQDLGTGKRLTIHEGDVCEQQKKRQK